MKEFFKYIIWFSVIFIYATLFNRKGMINLNKLKKHIALILTFCIFLSAFSICTNANAQEMDDYTNYTEETTQIKEYISFKDNEFIIDKQKMLADGIDKKYVKQLCKDYKEINKALSSSDLKQLENEKQEMLENLGPTERGKFSAAVKGIKKFLKKKWPKIIKKLPKPVRKLLTADAILAVIDAYVDISDSVEDLLTNCINAILPKPLEILTPGIVAVIMLFLPI